MPLASYPITLDFQGVAGIPFARQEMLRYTREFGDWRLELAVEEHNDEVSDPVYVAALAWDTDPALVRLSGLVGEVDDGLGGEEDIHGVNLSTTLSLWEGGTLDASYTFGEGIASYLVFLGDDVDAQGNAIGREAAYIGLAQGVGEKLTLRAILGHRWNERGAADATESLTSVHLNAEYEVFENTDLGIEYFHGVRDTFGGAAYQVDRIQASITYNF
jgi:hypothetical protein